MKVQMPMRPALLLVAGFAISACDRPATSTDKPAAATDKPAAASVTDAEDAAQVQAIARDAYIYAYAMIENYNTMYKQLADPGAPEYVGGFGKFRHYSQLYTPDNHDVVTPNNDTPYSWAWLDLRAEPWVVSVPAVAEDRYYVQQWVDLFTYNFAYVGSRATGNGAGHYLITGPRWQGEVPAGIDKTFKSETDLVMTLTRTAMDGQKDLPNVRKVQQGMQLQPLSSFAGTPPPPPAAPIEFIPFDRDKVKTHDFISYFNFLLQFTQPPHPDEVALMQRFARIGIGPGLPFDASKLPADQLAAIDAVVKQAQAEMAAVVAKTISSNGLFGSRQAMKNNYMARAIGAEMGLYGNSVEEAWYGGYVGDGTVLSSLHFSKDDLPPARYFWSVTLYTMPDRFLYANPLKRYSIGDRTEGLRYDADGGLTLYVGHASPGKDKESNWLPAPAGPYNVAGRVYGPSQAAIDGHWQFPAPQPVQ